MITILNRKELLITMDSHKQSDVRGILAEKNIPYITKTTNITNAQAVGSRRGHQGSFGVNQDFAYEYKIYVHKKDYEKAARFIR